MGVCLGAAPRVHTCGRVCARKGVGKTVSSCIHLQAIHALRAECAPPARNQCTLSKMVTCHEHQRSCRRLPSMPGPSCRFFTSQCAQLTSQNMLRSELEGFIAPQVIFRGKDFGMSSPHLRLENGCEAAQGLGCAATLRSGGQRGGLHGVSQGAWAGWFVGQNHPEKDRGSFVPRIPTITPGFHAKVCAAAAKVRRAQACTFSSSQTLPQHMHTHIHTCTHAHTWSHR